MKRNSFIINHTEINLKVNARPVKDSEKTY